MLGAKIYSRRSWRAVAFSAGGDGGPREHDYLERWCGGRALPWHRADLGFVGAHALSRCARVARMDSCDPLLATHFLLEKQVEARRFIRSPRRRGRAATAECRGPSALAVLRLIINSTFVACWT